MMSLDTTVVAHNNPLLRELQQGRKMRSLDALMNKLDEDQHRHVVHRSSVEQGLTMVHAAQATPTLITGEPVLAPATKQQQPSVAPYMGLVVGQSPLEASSPPQAAKKSHPDELRAKVAATRPDQASDRNGVLPSLARDDGTDRPFTADSVANASGSPTRPRALPPLQSQTAGGLPEAALAGVGADALDDRAISPISPPSGRPNPSSPLKDRHKRLADQEAPTATEEQRSRLEDNKEPELLRHDGSVMALALSPDGLNLVTGSDNILTVWNVAERSRKWEAKVANAVVVAACSPSGKHAACTTLDFSVSVWQIESGKKLWTRAMKSQATALAFHPRLDALAIGETNTRVNVVSIDPLENIITIEHSAPVKSLSFSPDGALVAIAGGVPNDAVSGDGYPPTKRLSGASNKLVGMRVCQVEIDSAQFKPVGLHTDVHLVAFAPSGEMLAAGIGKGQNRVAVLTCADGFKEVMDLPVSGAVTCLAWSPTSNFILCGGEDKQLTLWCLLSMTSQVLSPQIPEVSGPYRGLACLPDMTCVASCAEGDKFVRLNILTASKAKALLPGPPPEPAQSEGPAPPEESRLAQTEPVTCDPGPKRKSSGGGLEKPFNRESLRGAGTVKFGPKLDLKPDNRKPARKASIISIGDPSSGIQIKVQKSRRAEGDQISAHWMIHKETGPDLDLSKLARTASGEVKNLKKSTDVANIPLKHDDEVVGLAFSPDSDMLFAGSRDSAVVLWDVKDQNRCMEAKHEGYLKCVAYSRDGRYVAAGYSDSHIHVYRTDVIAELGTAHVEGEVISIDFTSKPDLLVVGTTARRVVLISIPEFDDLTELHHESPIQNLSCSPNGRFVAVAEGKIDPFAIAPSPLDRSELKDEFPAKMLMWSISEDGSNGSYVGCISFTDDIHAMAFSPSGAFLAAGGAGSEVSLLVAEKEFAKATDFCCAAAVRCLAWTSDSQFLASGGEDMQVTIWSLLQQRVLFKLPKASDWVSAVAFSPDCSLLATCGYGQDVVTLHKLDVTSTSGEESESKAPEVASRELPVTAPVATPAVAAVPVATLSIAGMGGAGLHAPVSPMFSAGTVKFDPQKAPPTSKPVGMITMPTKEDEEAMTIQVSDPSAPTLQVVQQPAMSISTPIEVSAASEEKVAPLPQPKAAGKSSLGLMPSGKTDLKSCGTVKMGGPMGAPTTTKTGTDTLGSQLSAAGLTTGGGSSGSRRPSNAAIVGLGNMTSGFQIKVKNTGDTTGSVAKHIQERKSIVASVHGLSAMFSRMEQCTSRSTATMAHEDEVLGLAWSPDGKSLVAAGEDSIVVLWDVEKMDRKFSHKMSGAVRAVAFSPDGQYFAAGDEDGSVIAWRADNFEEVGTIELEGSILTISMTSSPNQFLAAGTSAKKVMLLSIPDFEEIADLRHDGDVHSVQFSPNGKLLAGGGGTDLMHGLMTKKSKDHEMKTVVWQVEASGEDCKFLGSILFDDIVRIVAFSPSGKLLAVGSESRSITMLVVADDFEKASELACPAGVRCLCWSADSRFLASGGEDMQISVWDLINESVIFQLPKVKDWYCALAFAPGSTWLAACGHGSTAVTLHPIKAFQEDSSAGKDDDEDEEEDEGEKEEEDGDQVAVMPVAPLVVTPSMPTVVTPSMPSGGGAKLGIAQQALPTMGTVKFGGPSVTPPQPPSLGQKPQDSQEPKKADAPAKLEVGATKGNLSRRPSNAAVIDLGSAGFQIKVQKVSKAPKPLAQDAEKSSKSNQSFISLQKRTRIPPVKLPHQDEVMSLQFSPDGLYLVAGGEDCRVVLWDIMNATKKMEAQLSTCVKAVAYSPDGMYIAAAEEDSFVYVWDPDSCEEVGTSAMEGQILSLAMCGNPAFLAVGTTAAKVMLISIPDMEEIADLRHDGHVHSIAFSPDGAFLAGGGGTDEMHGLMTNKTEGHEMKTVIWQVSTTQEDCKVFGQIMFADIVHAVTFSPDGKTLASAGESMEISLLEVEKNFERRGQLLCPAGVTCLSWSSDSYFLISAGEDAQITVWDVSLHKIVFRFPKAKDWYCSVAMSPTSSMIAACGFACNEVTLYAVQIRKTGEEDDDTEQLSWPNSPASISISTSAPADAPPALAITAAPSIAVEGAADAPASPATPTKGKAAMLIGPAKDSNRLQTAAPTMQRRPSNAAVIDLGSQKSGFCIKVKNVGKKEEEKEKKLAKHIHRKTIADSLLGLSFLGSGNMSQETDRKVRELPHEDEVMGLAWSPDGKYLISGGEDCCMVLWDVEKGERALEVRFQTAVKAVAYSPNGQYIAAGDEESFVYVWRTETREQVGNANVEGSILSLALSSKPDLIAAGTTEKKVMLMTIPDFEEIADFRHDGHVHCLSFSPDSSCLAGGGGTDDMHGLMSKKVDTEGMKTVVWSIGLAGSECKYMGQISFPDIVRAVAFSPSGKLLAVGGESRSITMLVVHNDFERASELPCPAGVRSLSWSNDSHYLASAGEDMQISVWDLIKETVLYQYPKLKDWYCTVAFSPTYDWIASCGFGNNRVELYPIKRGETKCADEPEIEEENSDEEEEQKEAPPGPAISIGGAPAITMATPQVSAPSEPAGASAASAIQVNAPAAASGIQVNAPSEPAGASAGIQISSPSSPSPKVTPSRPKSKAKGMGAGLMVAKQEMTSMGTVKFGSKGPSAPPGAAGPTTPGLTVGTTPAQSSSASTLSVKPLDQSGRRPSKVVELGTSAEGFQMKVKDTSKGASRGGMDRSASSRSSQLQELIKTSGRGRVCMEPSSARSPVELAHSDEIMSLALSPDGTRIVAGGEDGHLVLWDIASATRLLDVDLGFPVKAVAYCPKGQYIAAGDEDCYLHVWDTEKFELVGKDRLEGLVLSLALCASPQLAAAGTTEKKVVLYTLPNMEEIADLRHDGHVHGVSFSSDGTMLAGGGGTDDMHGLMTNKVDARDMKTVIWQVSSDGDNCKFLGNILFPDIVHATEFSPCGKLLAVGGENRTISLLVVEKNFEKITDLFCPAGVLCLSWSSDSQFLASGGEDMQVSVWDLITERVVIQLPKQKDWVCGVSISPRCDWVALCGFGASAVTLCPVEIVAPKEHEAHLVKLHGEQDQWIHGGKGGHAL